jgi:hypothetical protein
MFMMLPQRLLLWVWYENLKKLVLCLLIPEVKIQVFWNVAVCHWLHAFRCFGETRFHSSVQNHSLGDTDSYSRRQESLTTLLWQCCKFYNTKGIIWYKHTEKTSEITHCVEKAVHICPRKSVSYIILITNFLEKALKQVRYHLWFLCTFVTLLHLRTFTQSTPSILCI